MTAAETRYGRRGGGWAARPVELPDDRPRPAPIDQSRRAHPDVIADDRARQRRGVPDPADHTAVWAGRARMAAARQAPVWQTVLAVAAIVVAGLTILTTKETP